jgi:hypothetical protein
VWSVIERTASWVLGQKVDELASTVAVRRAILRSLIRLDFDAYVRSGILDGDRAIGLAHKSFEELQGRIDLKTTDPESESVRDLIHRTTTLRAVSLGTWICLQELRRRTTFDPNQTIVIVFRDRSGSTHHTANLIVGLQSQFLFHRPIVLLSHQEAKIGDDVASMAEERISGEPVEILRSDLAISNVGPDFFRDLAIENPPSP